MAARYRVFSVRVAAVTPLTPHFVRVTLTGDALADFSSVGLDQRIKIVLPIPGHGFTDLPDGEDWYGAWRALPDEERNPLRTYTVRSFRPDAREARHRLRRARRRRARLPLGLRLPRR
ncbi:siderophore-interacting protein [Curtobacterium flaccumfaciens]|nr:siderophore-interacting protein [Curtobacterium flaccumfaciens]